MPRSGSRWCPVAARVPVDVALARPLDSADDAVNYALRVRRDIATYNDSHERRGTAGDHGPFGKLEAFEQGREVARAGVRDAGRDAEALTFCRLIHVAADDDRERAKDELTRFLHGYYGPWFDVETHAIFGPAAEVVEQRAAGIEHLMLGVPTLDHGQPGRLAEAVLLAVRDS